jgi:hypothetical protein
MQTGQAGFNPSPVAATEVTIGPQRNKRMITTQYFQTDVL